MNKSAVEILIQAGFGVTDISKELGVSKQRIHQVARGYGKTGKRGRKSFYKELGSVCLDCGGDMVALHHLDGNNKNDSLENLIPLCNSCHFKRHKGRKYMITKKRIVVKALLKSEDDILNKLPLWLTQKVADYRLSVEMYQLLRSGTTNAEIARMYKTSPQNVNNKIARVKKYLTETQIDPEKGDLVTANLADKSKD